MATPQHTPALWVIYKFGSASISQLPYTQFSVPCLRVEKTILKEKMHFQYIQVTWSRPSPEPLPHGS